MIQLNGASRVYIIIGDPIAQVKSPAGVTEAFQQNGLNALVIPAHVAPSAFHEFVQTVALAQNFDGIIVTVPHKFSAYDVCSGLTDRSQFLNAVNVIRRGADGKWFGDMCDGAGFYAAAKKNGGDVKGRRALLVGAGGAGSAIAHTLLTEGATVLAIHDEDQVRRDTLIEKLSSLKLGQVVAGSSDPTGYEFVVNATPIGMKESDPCPIQTNLLNKQAFVGDVITMPAVTPLIHNARAAGCQTVTGTEMFAGVKDLMIQFLLGK